MELVDTHCHINVAEFDADRRDVLARARRAGVTRLVVPAIDAAGIPALLDLCRTEQGLYPALGLHPVYVDQHRPGDLAFVARQAEQANPVAIGEIGLDYFLVDLDRAKQQELFEAQLRLAQTMNLPVLLHIRKSHDQVLSTLRRIKVCGGIAHAFNGSLQQAQQFMELGFRLGFGGTLTYDRAQKIRGLARALPIEAIVLETDAPDMVVSAHHGERNSPEYLPDCVVALAHLRNETAEFIAESTTRNACTVLGIS